MCETGLGPSVSIRFLLWLILLALSWPLALLALIAYPLFLVWLVLLPFALLGIAITGVFGLLKAVICLPFRLIAGRRGRAD